MVSELGACILWALAGAMLGAAGPEEVGQVRHEDGYRGIWFELGQKSEYGDKYSGGLGTYTAKHVPLAFYAPGAEKTFFVWGGTIEGGQHLLLMAGCYDHRTGMVSRPVVVHDKQGVTDPHDNPSICLDKRGHVWVFVAGRATVRDGYKYRSREPYSIEGFDLVEVHKGMCYPQPWTVEGQGILLLFTKYTAGRELYWQTSADGRAWGQESKLAGFGGHYQVSWQRDGRVITAFNWHKDGRPDNRSNLYFLQTDDLGRTWKTAAGQPVETPLTEVINPALVRDYHAEGRLVYMKDINFDADGAPVILHVTSPYHRPGPHAADREWVTARWTGFEWEFRALAKAWHNYDMGSLYVEPDGAWRVIAPTEVGPQKWGTGGEVAMWLSRDKGATWDKVRDLTAGSQRNHTYVRRPVNAHPDFYAFWADGNPDGFSESRLYFATRDGDVFMLPPSMEGDWAKPVPLK